MTTVYFDAKIDDDARRQALYDGDIFVYSPTPSSRSLCALAQEMITEAFAPHDPQDAQNDIPVEKFADILAKLKPSFIHDPRCKELIPGMLAELDCDLDNTYFDVPRLRSAAFGDYLSSGIAYAFKPHRDTWYSTPMCQLNWWLPVFDIEPTNAMAFHQRYWDTHVKNSSSEFNYQEWVVTGRASAKKHIGKDTRKQSEALEELSLEPDLKIIAEVGSVIVFSAAHLHSTVPNTSRKTRFSIDFRTVHIDELRDNSGAPNIDGKSTGTTIHDYLRGTDLGHVPEDIEALYINQ